MSTRATKRNIVVDGIAYTWKFRNWLEVRCDNRVVFRVSAETLLGLTPDQWERACWKRYCGVRPSMVARAIRERV